LQGPAKELHNAITRTDLLGFVPLLQFQNHKQLQVVQNIPNRNSPHQVLHVHHKRDRQDEWPHQKAQYRFFRVLQTLSRKPFVICTKNSELSLVGIGTVSQGLNGFAVVAGASSGRSLCPSG